MIKANILTRYDFNCGICSYIWTLFDLLCQVQQYKIPAVIDLKSYYYKLLSSKFEKINVWEDYLLLPYGISLDLVDEQCTVFSFKDFTMYNKMNYDDRKKIFQKLIKFNDNIIFSTNEFLKNIDTDNTIGVMIRGTDYINMRPYRHPLQPSIDIVIADIHNILNIFLNITHIFVMSESKQYHDILKKEFGNMYITNQYIYLENNNKYNYNVFDEMEYNLKKTINMLYLISLNILSKLKYALLGNTSATAVYKCMCPNDMVICKIYNLGIY